MEGVGVGMRERETETGHLREKWAPAEKKTEKCSEGERGG